MPPEQGSIPQEEPRPQQGEPESQPYAAPLPAYNWQGPLPDDSSNPSGNDTDSVFDSIRSVRSESLTSSIYNYRYENGRRYHAFREGTDYNLPNDDFEMDRLDLQHHLYLLTLGGALHKAPLRQDLHRVLDMGTGTGIWAVDFADQYPSAVVTGVDISPIQPIYVPSNCQFYIEDLEGQWTFSPDTFDYVHGRMLAVGIRNWPRLFSQAFDSLKPGGWLEIQDLCMPIRCDDGSAGENSDLIHWSKLMIQGAANLGCRLDVANYVAKMMEEAGFIDVQSEWYTWAMNRWPKDKKQKDIGTWAQQNLEDGLSAVSLGYFSKGLGWSREEIDVIVAKARSQVRDRKSHCYLPIGVFYGRKPEIPS